MNNNQEFSIWMSKVEFYLESMIKKSSPEFESYDYHGDFKRGVLPEDTATIIIQRSVQNGKERSMDNMSSM